MSLYEIVFGVPLVAGVLLVLGLAFGLAEFGSELEMDLDDGVEGDADGLLVALGVGRVPLSVLLLLLLLSFGGLGLVVYPLLLLAVSAGLALIAAWLLAGLGSLLVTRLLGGLFARYLPSVETYASEKRELVGRAAVVLMRLSDVEHVLRVKDAGGAELRVHGLSTSGRLMPGEEVLLTAYQRERDRYCIERIENT
jgi:membrane protein implicated in regulation of membrane protease activity